MKRFIEFSAKDYSAHGTTDCFVVLPLSAGGLLATTEKFASLRATTICGGRAAICRFVSKDFSALGTTDSFVPPEAGLGKTVFIWITSSLPTSSARPCNDVKNSTFFDPAVAGEPFNQSIIHS